jgi:hypothetical protein
MKKRIVMKKVMAVVLLGSAFCLANADSSDDAAMSSDSAPFYAGVDIIHSFNSVSTQLHDRTTTTTDNSNAIAIKGGWLFDGGWRMQGYFLHEKYDQSPLINSSSDTMNEIGATVIKTFETSSTFWPYVSLGGGYGWMDVNGYDTSSLDSMAVTVSVGAIYKASKKIELLAGVGLEGRTWNDVGVAETGGRASLGLSESAVTLSVGFNYLF